MSAPSGSAAHDMLLEVCSKAGVVQVGHFVLNSGRHSSRFFAKEELGKRPHIAQPLYSEMAGIILRASRNLCVNIDAIVAPAVSGVSLTEWVTYHAYFRGIRALALYAEKETVVFKLSSGENLVNVGGTWMPIPPGGTLMCETGEFVLKRNFSDDVKGKNVVVIDNVITTGNSMKRTAAAVRREGGNVVFGVALCNRGKVSPEGAGVPHLYEAVSVDFTSTPEDECELCKQGEPISTNFGHGATYLAKKRKAKMLLQPPDPAEQSALVEHRHSGSEGSTSTPPAIAPGPVVPMIVTTEPPQPVA